jgi:hypothetical protein
MIEGIASAVIIALVVEMRGQIGKANSRLDRLESNFKAHTTLERARLRLPPLTLGLLSGACYLSASILLH